MLVETVAQHIEGQSREDDRREEFFAIVSKLSVLEEEKTRAQLRESEEYAHLKERVERLGARLRDSIDDFEDILETYHDIDRGS